MSGARPGRFLVLEGIEGAGKSTQVKRLAAWLARNGIPHLVTREPGGTTLGESIRTLLLADGVMSARTELMLILAARATLVEEVVRPALAAGKIVLADRYELSTFAYQAGGRGLPLDAVREVNAFATGGLRPDLTILLDVPLPQGVARRGAKYSGRDRIERAGDAFHTRVAQAYGLLAEESDDVLSLDGTGTIDDVAERILAALAARFPETFRV